MGEVGVFGGDDYVELIDGEVLEMSPLGWRHVWCVNALNMLLAPGARPLRSQRAEPARLERVRRAAARPRAHKGPSAGPAPHPADVILVVKVFDTTLAYDRDVKLPRHATAGGPEVWILNLHTATADAHSEPYRKTTRYARGQRVTSATLPNLHFAAHEVLPPKSPKPEDSGRYRVARPEEYAALMRW